MEFLKQFFGDKALTYAELVKALEGSKEVKLGNLATGEYVGKGKYQAMETRVADLEEQIKTRDSDLSKLKKSLGENAEAVSQLEALKGQYKELETASQKKLKAMERSTRVQGKLLESGLTPKMLKAAMALCDDAAIGEDFAGLDKEMIRLKKDYAEMFQDTTPAGTGANGGNAGGSNGDDGTGISDKAAHAAVFGRGFF